MGLRVQSPKFFIDNYIEVLGVCIKRNTKFALCREDLISQRLKVVIVGGKQSYMENEVYNLWAEWRYACCLPTTSA